MVIEILKQKQVHHGTFKVFINFISADITFIHPDIQKYIKDAIVKIIYIMLHLSF